MEKASEEVSIILKHLAGRTGTVHLGEETCQYSIGCLYRIISGFDLRNSCKLFSESLLVVAKILDMSDCKLDITTLGLQLLDSQSQNRVHTGIVVYGNEYFFGGGIQHLPAGTTPYGAPLRTVEVVDSHVPKDVFEMYLDEISPRYTAESYNLLTHNCNNFLQQRGRSVSVPMIQNLETTLRAGAVPNAPQFRPQTEPFGAFSKDEGPKLPNKPSENQIKSEKASKSEDAKTSVPTEKASQVKEDPLGDARTKIQEEITREFAALMAQGKLRASEAAVMATKE
ncbi:hypothetical protein YC2023_081221 [Brassica napus]